MEEDGWREGSSEDKCALSFPSERNPLPEAHIYTVGNRRETTFLFVEKKISIEDRGQQLIRGTSRRNSPQNFGLSRLSVYRRAWSSKTRSRVRRDKVRC